MVDSSSEVSWFEEVDGVKIGNVDTPGVGLWALRPVLLDVHPEEADVDPVLLLEGEHGAGTVWEVIQHVASVHIPAKMIMSCSMYQNVSILRYIFQETIQLQHQSASIEKDGIKTMQAFHSMAENVESICGEIIMMIRV